MTPKQAEEIREVIWHDATVQGSIIVKKDFKAYDFEENKYLDLAEPLYCILGGLGKAAGIKNDHLIGNAVGHLSVEARDAIRERFGLSTHQLAVLHPINDAHEDLLKRRAALCKRIDIWEARSK